MLQPDITCLVVDDEPDLRRSLVRVLGGAGYRCLEAASGAEALEVLERRAVEMVLTDLRMPHLDGATLLTLIHKRWPDVAVILVTVVAELETAVACLRRGAMDYITKPFQIEEVRARIAHALERRRLVVENRRYQRHLTELVEQQARRIEELFLEGVQAVVDALEAKDPYTRGHSARVSAYAGQTARALRLSELDVELIELGAELHDVGKIGVREAVLLKPGRLTDREYEHLTQHTVIGERILAPLFKNAPAALAIVRSHHERMDGRGFPDGLLGDAIPLHARIVTVCDSFDAMTSGRPYRPAVPPADAVAELRAQAGAQFDATVVAAFLDAYPGLQGLPIEAPAKPRRSVPGGIAGVGVS